MAVGNAQSRTLTVEATPYAGVVVAASPADLNGAEGGQTAFTREYSNGTVVGLEVPAVNGAHAFVKWQRDGVDFSSSPDVNVTMNASHTMTAVYFANSEVLTNGSFEDGMSAWKPSGNVLVEAGAPYVASDGSHLLVFNGNQEDPDGIVSQTFATVSGTTYTLAFDIGVLADNTKEQILQVTVTGSGELLSESITLTGTVGWDVSWSPRTYPFTANSPETTVTFADLSLRTSNIDLLLDKVRVGITPGDPPVATGDVATMHAGQKVLLPVLANDSGIMDPGSVEIVTPPATGVVTVHPSGEILYAHPGGNMDPVSFTYRVSGEGGVSAPASVDIAIATTLRIPPQNLNVPTQPPATAVKVEPAFPGVTFVSPLCMASPPDDPKRLFVCEIGGKIKVISDVTAQNPTSSVVLDLVQVISNPPRIPAEQWVPGVENEAGLMGLAFHPNYASNGFIYLSYMIEKSTDRSVWYNRLSRFKVPAAQIGQPAPVADPASEVILIEQRKRQGWHNGTAIHFGADGYLYWVIGDEADPDDVYGNSKRIDMNFFAAMLRIDVDKKPGNLEPSAHPNPSAAGLGYNSTDSVPRDESPAGSGEWVARYSIPIDNPFVHTSQGGSWDGTFNGSAITAENLPYVRSEFWAVGLRSPWQFSIDKPTGEIWLGDVGQDEYEELNLIVRGGHYGWAFKEGTHPGPDTPPAGLELVDPIYEYPHTSLPGDSNFKGNSITGGVVYRGSRFSGLAGAYIFGDYVSGHIWALRRNNGSVEVERIAGQPFLSAFGTDPSNGDVLLTDYPGGRIMRLVEETAAVSPFPTTLSATRIFADLTDLSPAPGVLPYQPNLTFWSDYAVKSRWFVMPDAAAQMTWSRDGAWGFPSGQIWVKHFDIESERGNPDSPKKRVETRLLVKNAQEVFGVSYRWNALGTEATLVDDGGEDFTIDITVDGAPYVQQWSIPSRAQCKVCHSPQAGEVLSFNTRQLNRVHPINGFGGNQLDLLHAFGYFANSAESSNLLPRHVRPEETGFPVEARVRSYLAVNCSYCHAGAGGTAPPAWDGRHELTLEETGLVNGHTGAGGEGFKLIVPGDAAHSVVLQRMGATGGFTRMPPLATHEVDPAGIALVTEWINGSLPGRMSYAEWRLAVFGSPDSAEGAPGADPDGDRLTNAGEFLAGTLAKDGGSFLNPIVSRAETAVSLDFTIPENRSVQVWNSQNLTDWSLWDVPGNDGVAQPGGETTISGPSEAPRRFYRLLIRER